VKCDRFARSVSFTPLSRILKEQGSSCSFGAEGQQYTRRKMVFTVMGGRAERERSSSWTLSTPGNGRRRPRGSAAWFRQAQTHVETHASHRATLRDGLRREEDLTRDGDWCRNASIGSLERVPKIGEKVFDTTTSGGVLDHVENLQTSRFAPLAKVA